MSRLYKLCVVDEHGRLLLSTLVLAAGLICVLAGQVALAGLTLGVYGLERVLAVLAYAIEHKRSRLLDQIASEDRHSEHSLQIAEKNTAAIELTKKVVELESKVRKVERSLDDPMARLRG